MTEQTKMIQNDITLVNTEKLEQLANPYVQELLDQTHGQFTEGDDPVAVILAIGIEGLLVSLTQKSIICTSGSLINAADHILQRFAEQQQ